MIRFASALAPLLLVACASGGRPLPPPVTTTAAPVLSSTEFVEPAAPTPAAPVQDPRPGVLAAGLPAMLKTEAPLRMQPRLKAGVLQTLPAATTLRVLGDLDNAEGRWLNVQIDQAVGWVPAGSVQYSH